MIRLILFAATLLAVARPDVSATVETVPPDTRAVKSDAYRVTVGGREVFVTKFRDVSYASFSFSGTIPVAVQISAPVTTFNVSPHVARITARAEGSTLKFNLDRPRRL